MDLKYVSYIQAIARAGSVTAAARELYMTQPALSMSLKKYEEELGYPIFLRTSRGLTLTREGEIFLDTASRMLGLERAMFSRLSDDSGEMEGHVIFGLSQNRAPWMLPQILPAYHGRYPKVRLELVEGRTKELVHKLERGEIDLGFLIPPLESREIACEQFMKEELLFAVPKAYGITTEGRVSASGLPWLTLEELADYPFLLYHEDNRVQDFVRELFQNSRLYPEQRMIVGGIASLARLASSGMGAAVLPEGFIEPQFELDYFSIGQEGYFRDLALGYPSDTYRSRPVQLFAEMVVEVMQENHRVLQKRYK